MLFLCISLLFPFWIQTSPTLQLAPLLYGPKPSPQHVQLRSLALRAPTSTSIQIIRPDLPEQILDITTTTVTLLLILLCLHLRDLDSLIDLANHSLSVAHELSAFVTCAKQLGLPCLCQGCRGSSCLKRVPLTSLTIH
jgi:hypothetical protein